MDWFNSPELGLILALFVGLAAALALPAELSVSQMSLPPHRAGRILQPSIVTAAFTQGDAPCNLMRPD